MSLINHKCNVLNHEIKLMVDKEDKIQCTYMIVIILS